MRTYEKTHPWLSFSADLKHAPMRLWLMLGECQSKCEHIAKTPLRPATAYRLYQVYLAKGALATTAIEGNTLSEEQVLRHLAGELELPPSRRYLGQEVDNIVDACNAILKSIGPNAIPPITTASIRELNKSVLTGLDYEDGVVPGEFRRYSVGVGKYRAAPAEDCEFLVDKLCDWLTGESFAPPPGQEIVYAILKAVLAHLYVAWIHPFGDGNGRTARLVEFKILISSGVPAASAHLLSNHYNLTRTEYYRQLDRASRSGGDIVHFLVYAVQGFRDGLVTQLNEIWQQQWDVAWRNYVHESFRDKPSPSDRRRRHLALDLSLKTQPVPLSQIPNISTRLAEAYASKTRKTLTRDMNALCEMGLVEKTTEGYRARREIILSFQPQRVSDLPVPRDRSSSK